MRTAVLVALAIALALILWWSRDDDRSRARRPEPRVEAIEAFTPEPDTPEAATPAEESPAVHAPGEEAAEPATALPPDPVESGECALFLRFVDAATGQPVATAIDLWRLDAPGNEHWLEGDQLQLATGIAAEGTTLEDLPEGEYRPVCAAQRFGAEDPPPVRVRGPLSEVTIAVELPGTFQVHLKVYDANGHPLPAARVRRSGDGWSSGAQAPPWRKQRALRDPSPGNLIIGVGRGGGRGGFTGRRSPPVPQPPEGFRLGPISESAKGHRTTSYYRAELEGLNDVQVLASGDRTDERTYVGVMVPVETLVRDVRLPDGRPASMAGARITATCTAALAEEAAQGDFWRHLPISVAVEMAGCKTLRFEQRLADPSPVHVLEPE